MAESTSIRFALNGDSHDGMRQLKQPAASAKDLVDDVETGAVQQEERDFKRKQARSVTCVP